MCYTDGVSCRMMIIVSRLNLGYLSAVHIAVSTSRIGDMGTSPRSSSPWVDIRSSTRCGEARKDNMLDSTTPELLAIYAAAATVAGFIDTLAGGGGLITVPALLLGGMPPLQVLGTNKLQGVV